MSDAVKFKKGLSKNLPTTKESGTFLLETDTGTLYVDESSSNRVQIKDNTKAPKDHNHDDVYAPITHTHSNYFDSTQSRTANTVLAAPNGSNGSASFRKLTLNDMPFTTATTASDGLMSSSDKALSNALVNKYRYWGADGRTGYFKVKINSKASWMMNIHVRLYSSYEMYDFIVSGYNFAVDKKWFAPTAIMLGSLYDNSLQIIFGYTDVNDLWFAVPHSNYSTIAIVDVLQNSNYGRLQDMFTIDEVATEDALIKAETEKIQVKVTALGSYTKRSFSLKNNYGSASALGWSSSTDNSKLVPTLNTLTYWNGAFQGTTSNLLYTAVGALGNAATLSKSSVVSDVSISSNKLTFTKADDTTKEITLPTYSNTTYTFATGTANGTISVKASTDSSATNVAVYGLGSAAYTKSTDYATSTQGTKADNAMPKSGGTFTGNVTLNADPTADLGAATKKYVDNKVSNAVSSVFKFKGTVANEDSLPSTGNTEGDVYHVTSNHSEYIWAKVDGATTASWEELGSIVDLSDYAISNDVIQRVTGATDKVPKFNENGTLSSTGFTLGKSVPSDAVFKYTASKGITISGTDIQHTNSITAGTAQGSATKPLAWNDTFTIPTVTYDAYGHITAKGTTTMTMPANPNTDTKVTAVGNHYTPTGGTTISASGGTLTDITNSTTGVQVITGITKDAAGHVTGVTSKAIKSTNSTYSIGNGTLTINQNGTSKGTFTANQSDSVTINLTDTTYEEMSGATSSKDGTSGLVPTPTAGNESHFLKGDGTWATPGSLYGYYTGNGGQHSPSYFGKNNVTHHMMNTTVNYCTDYKDWLVMDCYSGDDVGGGVALGVDRQADRAFIMRATDATRTSWRGVELATLDRTVVSNDADLTTNFRTSILGRKDGGIYHKMFSTNVSTKKGFPIYGLGMAWGYTDVNAYIMPSPDSAEVWIGAGGGGEANQDKISWQRQLAFKEDLSNYLKNTGGTLTGALCLNVDKTSYLNTASTSSGAVKLNYQSGYVELTPNTVTIKAPGGSVAVGTDGVYISIASTGHFVTNKAYTVSSDKNLKHDIIKLDDKYDKFFDSLKPVSYKFDLDSEDKIHCGFIAQDIEKSLSESNIDIDTSGILDILEIHDRDTTEDKNGNIVDNESSERNYLLDKGINKQYGLKYDEFIALAIDQIQKLKKRVEKLEIYNNELKDLLNTKEI